MRFKSSKRGGLMNIWVAILVAVILPGQASSKATSVTTEPICLNNSSSPEYHKIVCDKNTGVIFISLVQYSDDVKGECDKTRSTKLVTRSPTRCTAYTTERSASVCNGRNECAVKLVPIWFDYGRSGSNCAFWARQLTITYECIPQSLDDHSIERTDICTERLIQHPVQGFIHSPNYPNAYNPTSYCQLTIKRPLATDRIEIFLIDLLTEEMSKRTYSPTDYLQINNREILFGEKKYLIVFNESTDAIITFKTDLFFNKRGFLLFYRVVKQVVNLAPNDHDSDIDMIEVDEDEKNSTTSTTKTIPTTTTTEVTRNQTINSTKEASFTAKLSSDDKKLTDQQLETYEQKINHITDHTFKAIIFLIGIILVLTSVVMFMVFKNRKSLCGHSAIYKAVMNANRSADVRLYDQSFVNQYLDTSMALIGTNASAIFAANPNQTAFIHPLIYQKRVSDDSTAQLLLLSTSRNSAPIELTKLNTAGNQNPNQVYDDISEAFEFNKSSCSKAALNSSKVNEYCYIPASGITAPSKPIDIEVKRASTRGRMDPNQPVCSSWLSSEEDQETEETTHSSRSSQSSPVNSSHTPILPHHVQATSTPCPPKSQPPSKEKPLDDESENSYDVPDRTSRPTEYEQFKTTGSLDDFINETGLTVITNLADGDESRTVIANNGEAAHGPHQDEENYEYQVPSNLDVKSNF